MPRIEKSYSYLAIILFCIEVIACCQPSEARVVCDYFPADDRVYPASLKCRAESGSESWTPAIDSGATYRSDCGGQLIIDAENRLKAWLMKMDANIRERSAYGDVSGLLKKKVAKNEPAVFCLSVPRSGKLDSIKVIRTSGTQQLDNKLASLISSLEPLDLVFNEKGLSVNESAQMTKNHNLKIGEFTGGAEDLE